MKKFSALNRELNEGRPSQRHPLEGHEYHKKSNDALVHIAKDAHKAAEAMKDHNTDAENKYRDQANDSATVRHFRQKNGMPDWYKKKYGHMKEENDTTEKVEMVQSQLHFIKYACEEILEYIDDGGEVEEWYQVKVAKSFSEFESLHAFIEGESRRTGMKESKEPDPHENPEYYRYHKELQKYSWKPQPIKKVKKTPEPDPHENPEYYRYHKEETQHKVGDSVIANSKFFGKQKGVVTKIDKQSVHVKREGKKFSEKYPHDSVMKEEVQKHPFVAVHAKKGTHQTHGSTSYEAAQNAAKHWKMKNTAGIDVYRADKKHVAEETEQLDELSKDTMKSYNDKAMKTPAKNNWLSRIKGIATSSEKLKKEETELDSLSPASMTLKEKPNKEPMPKMKKEETEPPFKPDAKSKQKVIVGKAGKGMATARHLARMALKRQVDKMKPVKESLEESRKAEIVKEAMKKKKDEIKLKSDEKFQSEPVLTSQIVKENK